MQLGNFIIDWRGAETQLPRLQISHRDNPTKVVWQTIPDRSFVSGANIKLKIAEERGSVEIDERKRSQFFHQTVTRLLHEGDLLTICGQLQGARLGGEEPQYRLSLQTAGSQQLDFQLQI